MARKIDRRCEYASYLSDDLFYILSKHQLGNLSPGSKQVAEISMLSRDDMEKIIEDGIAREYPAESRDERVTMAELLIAPIEASQSRGRRSMDLDM